jgi:chaperone required for assembly of F1-ATPase
MTGRDRKQKESSSRNLPTVGRQSQFFIDGDGIDREVITTDICRYLGNDALVRPGTHKVGLQTYLFEHLARSFRAECLYRIQPRDGSRKASISPHIELPPR